MDVLSPITTQGVNLRQLEYFVVIAEEGSFTRAAERLLVAQPSLSQQIGALEAELGGALLERLPRGVRLTMAGQNFLPDARAAISHANRARRSVRMALSLESGQLEIATITSAAAGILPSALRRWQELPSQYRGESQRVSASPPPRRGGAQRRRRYGGRFPSSKLRQTDHAAGMGGVRARAPAGRPDAPRAIG